MYGESIWIYNGIHPDLITNVSFQSVFLTKTFVRFLIYPQGLYNSFDNFYQNCFDIGLEQERSVKIIKN